MKKILLAMFFLFAFPANAFSATPIWELTPADGGYVFGSADCDVATGHTCPPEMGWEGNTIYYIFNLPSDAVLAQKLELQFNVIWRNYGVSQDVLLQISAGKIKSSLAVIKPGLDINQTGPFRVLIDSGLFQKGAANYIKFFGTNISPIGYGTNPPNFKINYIALKNSGSMGPAPVISDAELLDKTEAQAAAYFYEQALSNGLVKDSQTTSYSSIAATGFGLAAFTAMAERYGSNADWNYSPAQLRARANQILGTLITIQNNQATSEATYGKSGLFYHFINPDNSPAYGSEVSTIDSAILFAGVITAGEYFGGEVKQKAQQITGKADWNYFLKTPQNNFPTNNGINYQFSHGWKGGAKFAQTWDRPSDETMLVSIIALASNPENTDVQKSLFSWPRVRNSYAGYDVVNSYFGSLFTYEFGHAFIDFEKIGSDNPATMPGVEAINWWQNSVNAAKAARQFAIDNSGIYKSYGADSWGLSAVQKPNGAYDGLLGALPSESQPVHHDGTIAPYSSIGTMPLFKSEDGGVLANNKGFRTLRNYYDLYYWDLWGKYGPKDSFNDRNEFSQAYLGLDQGPIVLMVENYRTGAIWNQFLKNEPVKAALKKVFECPNGVCNAKINCYSNSDCNTDGVYDPPSCDRNDLWQSYYSYACYNPGTAESYCGKTGTVLFLKEDCGEITFEPWAASYCDGPLEKRDRAVHNNWCNAGACHHGDATETRVVENYLNNFTVDYQANALPQDSTPAWERGPGTPEIEAIENGTLHLGKDFVGDSAIYKINTSFQSTKPYEIETRVKIAVMDYPMPYGAIALNVQDEKYSWDLMFTPNSVELGHSATFDVSYPMDTTDGFHTYKIITDNGFVSLFVDGAEKMKANLTWTDKSYYAGNEAPQNPEISFGSSTGGSGPPKGVFFAESYWDYVKARTLVSDGVPSEKCQGTPPSNVTIWSWGYFWNPYRVFKSWTCDVNGNQYCPTEFGWQGSSITFKFKLNGSEQLTDLVKFNFGIGSVFTAQPVTIYAGSSLKKIQGNIIVNHSGTYSVEIPSAVFKKGTNYIQIYVTGVKVGYGRPTQGFLLGSVSLETYRNYNKQVLECPGSEIGDGYAFSWQPNDFNESTFYLQIGYSPQFNNKTFTQITTKQNATQILRNYATMITLAKKATDNNKLYARVMASHPLRGNAYSNACVFALKQPAAPVLQCPTTAITDAYAFEWNKGDYSKVYLQMGYDANFKAKTFFQVYDASSPTEIKPYYSTLIAYENKTAAKALFARLYTIDKYNRTTYSNRCDFNLKAPVAPALQCPADPVVDTFAFEWNKGDYSKVYLQMGYDANFKAKTFFQAYDAASPTEVKPYYSTLIAYENKTAAKALFARLYTIDKYNRTTYSNRCDFNLKAPVAPALQCPAEPINQSYAFQWAPGDYKNIYLQIGYNRDFARKTYLQISDKQSPTEITNYYTALQAYKTKNPTGTIYARIYATDQYTRIGYSNACEFSRE